MDTQDADKSLAVANGFGRHAADIPEDQLHQALMVSQP
jgi:hypothetical protein